MKIKSKRLILARNPNPIKSSLFPQVQFDLLGTGLADYFVSLEKTTDEDVSATCDALADAVGIPHRVATPILDEVVDALAQVDQILDAAACHHPVSRKARADVHASRRRLQR